MHLSAHIRRVACLTEWERQVEDHTSSLFVAHGRIVISMRMPMYICIPVPFTSAMKFQYSEVVTERSGRGHYTGLNEVVARGHQRKLLRRNRNLELMMSYAVGRDRTFHCSCKGYLLNIHTSIQSVEVDGYVPVLLDNQGGYEAE
jgi:hypothetical protein